MEKEGTLNRWPCLPYLIWKGMKDIVRKSRVCPVVTKIFVCVLVKNAMHLQ